LEIIGAIVCFISYESELSFKGPFLTFLLFAIIEVVNGAILNGTQSVKKPIYLEIGLCIFIFFVINRDSLEELFKITRSAGLMLSIFGCIEFAIKDSYFIRLIDSGGRIMSAEAIGTSRFRVRTIFLQPMPCATVEVFFWIVFLFFPYKNRVHTAIARLLIFICLVGTQTRSSWLAFILINLVYFMGKSTSSFRIRRNFIRVLPIIGLLFAAICAINGSIIANVLNLISSRWIEGINANSATYYNRFTQVKRAVAIWNNGSFSDKLFGKGYGYLLRYLRLHPIRGFTTAVDMQYAAILVDCGVVSVILLIIVFVHAWICYATRNDAISKACAFGVINIMISGFFYEILGWTSVMIVFAICLRGLTFLRQGN
jgi:hypothetical protein